MSRQNIENTIKSYDQLGHDRFMDVNQITRDAINTYIVYNNGRYPLKMIYSVAMNISVNEFTTYQAIPEIERWGFEIVRI